MKKELLMILVIIGLPTIFIMNLGSSNTGAVVNGASELRNARIHLYLNFPQPVSSPVHQMLAFRIRDRLRKGAGDEFYSYTGLRNGFIFFDNELELVDSLLVMACAKESEFIPRERLIAPRGLRVNVPRMQMDDVGIIPCNPALQMAAIKTLEEVLVLDLLLVEMRAEKLNCPTDALIRVRQHIDMRSYETAIGNIRYAWSICQ